jgi:hypothetical protein
MVGHKNQGFWTRIKGVLFLNRSMNYGSLKSAKIVLSKSIFCVENKPIFFKTKILFKNISLGEHFLVKTFSI